ncbi:hypothetical protein GGR56DRAFT_83087 [Xylariaceae sp. FL0804]|nr:hypothetical protein GGR56DRAFT_83087 [Xylariaceae sp. FL0804]
MSPSFPVFEGFAMVLPVLSCLSTSAPSRRPYDYVLGSCLLGKPLVVVVVKVQPGVWVSRTTPRVHGAGVCLTSVLLSGDLLGLGPCLLCCHNLT